MQLESKFRVCCITSLQTRFNHTLGALVTEVCTNITDSLRDIDESEPDAYEQRKTLLMSRYTKACWTRAFELLQYPELGDMKPTNLMQQMKALLPTDSKPCTAFTAIIFLCLPPRRPWLPGRQQRAAIAAS
jgi:hypothetical protein